MALLAPADSIALKFLLGHIEREQATLPDLELVRVELFT